MKLLITTILLVGTTSCTSPQRPPPLPEPVEETTPEAPAEAAPAADERSSNEVIDLGFEGGYTDVELPEQPEPEKRKSLTDFDHDGTCKTAADCVNKPHPKKPGSWKCKRNKCKYVGDPLEPGQPRHR